MHLRCGVVWNEIELVSEITDPLLTKFSRNFLRHIFLDNKLMT